MADNPMTLVSLESVKDLVREHLEHGEFVHGGRYECADAILTELDRLAALKQPRTQWQPRITREQVRDFARLIGYTWKNTEDSRQTTAVAVTRLSELGIEVLPEPPEASRE